MEGWFALAEQLHTQSDPAFCGLGTPVVALHALEIDPGRIWKARGAGTPRIAAMRAAEPASGALAAELAGLREQLDALARCAR